MTHDTVRGQNLTIIKTLTYLMFAMFAMTTDSVGVIIPEVIRTLKLSLTAAGTFQYATMTGIAVAGLLLGSLADRFGRWSRSRGIGRLGNRRQVNSLLRGAGHHVFAVLLLNCGRQPGFIGARAAAQQPSHCQQREQLRGSAQEPPRHDAHDPPPPTGCPIGRPAFRPLTRFEGQGLADVCRGHVVVFADAEIEQLAIGVCGQSGAFGSFDFLELVDGGAFAVVGTADAVGKQRLKPRIRRGTRHSRSFLKSSGLRVIVAVRQRLTIAVRPTDGKPTQSTDD